MASMKHSTHSISINAPFDGVWDYISDWYNQPKWATNFVLSMRQDGEQIYMTTPYGEAPIQWRTNRELGTIDIINQDGSPTPSRLIEIGDSLQYIFTFSVPIHVPDEVFRQGQINMDEELANLKRIIEEQVTIHD